MSTEGRGSRHASDTHRRTHTSRAVAGRAVTKERPHTRTRTHTRKTQPTAAAAAPAATRPPHGRRRRRPAGLAHQPALAAASCALRGPLQCGAPLPLAPRPHGATWRVARHGSAACRRPARRPCSCCCCRCCCQCPCYPPGPCARYRAGRPECWVRRASCLHGLQEVAAATHPPLLSAAVAALPPAAPLRSVYNATNPNSPTPIPLLASAPSLLLPPCHVARPTPAAPSNWGFIDHAFRGQLPDRPPGAPPCRFGHRSR